MNDQDRDTRGRRMLAGLLSASHVMPLESLSAKTAEHAAEVGFTQVLIYVADLQGDVMRLMSGEDADTDTPVGEEIELKIEGTVAGRAFQHGQVLAGADPDDGRGRWWVPLVDGIERLGVLRITTALDDERALEDMKLLAALIAFHRQQAAQQ